MKVNIEELALNPQIVESGQKIFLSGTVYTARDAAHARIINILDKGANACLREGMAISI